MNTFHNLSDEQLIADIENIGADMANAFVERCYRLTELDKRKKAHPLHRDPCYRHHAAVTSGALIPAIVAMFNGSKPHMACFHGRDKVVQGRVASGRELEVATVSKGEIIVRSIRPSRMTLDSFRLVFPAGQSVRPTSEQKALLEEKLKQEPQPQTHLRGKPLIRSVPGENPAIRIGGQGVPISVLKTALAELGLQVVELDHD